MTRCEECKKQIRENNRIIIKVVNEANLPFELPFHDIRCLNKWMKTQEVLA